MRMKKEKQITFNPADYDYMDDMPLDGWIWEFVRRNSGYGQLYFILIKNSLRKDLITTDGKVGIRPIYAKLPCIKEYISNWSLLNLFAL